MTLARLAFTTGLVVDVLLELVQLLPKRAQWVISGLLAALLITFLGYLIYLYLTGNLW